MKLFSSAKRILFLLNERKFTTIAGTLAFFLLTSALPLAFWISLILGRWSNLNVLSFFDGELFSFWNGVFSLLQKYAAAATQSLSFMLLSSALFGAVNLFFQLRRAGELLYDFPKSQTGWRVRLSAFVFLALSLVLFSTFFVLIAGGYTATSALFGGAMGKIVAYALSFVFSFLLSFLLNVYVCPYRVAVGKFLPGATLTSLTWVALFLGFSLYLKIVGISKLYGALSGVLFLLFWLNSFCVAFVVGVLLNSKRLSRKEKFKKLF